MTGWTPLFGQIVASSIWGHSNHVRIAWVTLLALSNRYGVAAVTTGGLARMANISPEEAQEALDVLSSPDPDTLTQANEGRRIERCETGWRLLNWEKYRESAKQAILREQNRDAQARYRARVAEGGGDGVEAEKDYHPETKAVLRIFNDASGLSFKEVDSNLTPISARLKEPDVTVDGITRMVVRLVAEWKGTKMEKYLRPETVFNATKFQGYYQHRGLPLNAAIPGATNKTTHLWAAKPGEEGDAALRGF